MYDIFFLILYINVRREKKSLKTRGIIITSPIHLRGPPSLTKKTIFNNYYYTNPKNSQLVCSIGEFNFPENGNGVDPRPPLTVKKNHPGFLCYFLSIFLDAIQTRLATAILLNCVAAVNINSSP